LTIFTKKRPIENEKFYVPQLLLAFSGCPINYKKEILIRRNRCSTLEEVLIIDFSNNNAYFKNQSIACKNVLGMRK
jgi:hypothetical protein